MSTLTDHALARMSATDARPDVEAVRDDRVDCVTLRYHLVSEILDQAPLYVPDTAAAVDRVGVAVSVVAIVDPSYQAV